MVAPAQAAAANPILIVTNSSNPYTTFLPEILRAEGFNEFDTADISAVSGTTLPAYDLAVLGDMSLTASQASMFSLWVNSGGNLIVMHPDPQLAGLLGLVNTGAALSNGYVLMNTSAGPGTGLVGQTIQFHGPAELYTLNGATSYATLYSNASAPTGNPALTLNQAGSGQAAAFTYDLARSAAYTRQGNPAWSGEARDGNSPIRSDNLFFGAASFDLEPDWVDFNKIQIPQADEQQRLLANLILQMNMGKKPLPRFWYLPKGLKAAVIMTGDDHGSFYSGSSTVQRFNDFLADSPSGCSVANWECVRGTAYLFPNIIASNPLTTSQVASYLAQGFEIGVHVDSATDCSDWTTSALDATYTNFLASWAAQFPTLPAPQTHRMHCVSWSDYDSQPQIELKHGIRLDTTYYYWPGTWINDRPGLFTGSGMPMRFTDRNGNVLDIYQAATQMTDESGQSYPLHINTLLDNALGGAGYYGVFTANMHNDGDTYPGPGANQIVASAQARGVPVVSALQMLQWLDGRNGSSFGSLTWSGNVLSFSVTAGANANNLGAMLPANAGSLGLSSLTLNGGPVSYQLQTIKGMQYAMFAASAGNYQATYGGSPLFSISGTITPAVTAAGATVTAVGPVTVAATPDNYGNYSLNGLPSGTYILAPSKNGSTFTPASQAVTVSGTNVTAVNFNAVQICPCSLWNNSVVPGTPSANDPNPVELGVRFTTDVSGYITGIRFYKGSTNTGTHIGNLWTNAGTLLGTATFNNETATGWQQVSFTTPVAIAANTTYVASYHTDAGNYSFDYGYFASAFDNVPLHAVQDASSGPNGVYLYGTSAFPTSTYLSTNYYVDVVFTTGQNYSISGTISGAGGNGATVSLSGASSATVTADASGNYSFNGLANGAFTVTPSNSGFTFTPASQDVTVNNASVSGANFSTVVTTYSISGTISGVGGNGATVSLSGASTAAVTADASGNYTFSGWTNGSYTVTPSKSGFTFTPASQNVTVNNASVAASTSARSHYTISGTISGAGGNGATVTLSGAASATVTATATGTYTFSNLVNGSYTVTSSKSGFTFTPASQNVTVSNASVAAVNFSTVTYTISGTISGAGGNGATVTLSGAASATVTATATGTYTFSNLVNGSYTVTPSKSGFTFTPASQNVTVNNASVTAVNFSTVTYTISGTISGTGGNGATVTLSGAASATVTASATGTYTFSNLVNGAYTVTPSKSGFAFTAASQNVTVSNANVTAVNFSTVTYTISGTISGTGGNAATVTLSGAASATVTASATGTYTFSNLVNGAYTVTPSKAGYTFTSASRNVTVNNASVTAVNFSSATATYTISGTISGAGGNGATVTLSGAASATVTASATGTYTFSGRANGSYTVTPSKAGYIFTPANKAVTVSGANVTGVNFTSTAQLAIDKTVSADASLIVSSITSPAFSTAKTNELLLALVSTNGSRSGVTVTGVTGGNLTWSLVRRTNTQQGTAEIWRAFSASTLSNVTVRASLSQTSTAATITVVTFSGVDTSGTGGSGAIGATGSANASSGAETASLTTTRNNSWVLGVGTDSQRATSRTVGPNQTMVHQDTPALFAFTGWVQRQNSTTPTSGTAVTINDTAPTNDRYDLTLCEVLPAQ